VIGVLLADDHAVVREGLRRILEEHSDLHVVAEVGTGDEVMRALRESPADVVVLDISMPGPGVFSLLARLKAEYPKIRCVVLTMHPEGQYAVRVLQAGAAGFLSKEQSPDFLVIAIRKAYSGGVYVTPSLAEHLAGAVASPHAGEPHEALSDRELEVLVRIAGGQSIKAISADLGISPKTVSTYHSRIRRKLDLTSDAELIRYALEHHLTL
jgi:two-component system invasion response regulator UvrY